MATIAIVGAGVMGSAVAFPLSDNGHEVRLVGTHLDTHIISSVQSSGYHPALRRSMPKAVTAYQIDHIDEALEGVELIVSGVNSEGVDWQGRTLGASLRSSIPIVAITKGMEVGSDGSLITLNKVLEDGIVAAGGPQCEVSGIGGPCIAGELAGRRPSCVLVGSPTFEHASRISEILKSDYYFVRPTTRRFALEIGVALKNGFTLGVGIASGFLERAGGEDHAGAAMHNLEAAVFAEGTSEIRRLLEVHGAPERFAASLPGAGDYFVTVVGGRNIRFARMLGAGKTVSEALEAMQGTTLEGLSIVRSMARALPLLKSRGVLQDGELPLLEYLVGTLEAGYAEPFPLAAFFPDLD
ncbi:MAG: NAD(P)H-dependent glycerol-3-phosphate dehydrogenase [Spirochaetota bacterium]